jgi:molybdate transport system substrate-binding protein
MSPLTLLVAIVILAGCASGSIDDPPGAGAERTIVVLAAASLADVFDEMTAAFEDEHPEVAIETSVAGSSSLAVQIEEGAPADVVAMADVESMRGLGGLVDDVDVFAMNDVVIATPVDDPGDISEIADLERSGVLVGVCAGQVPCGRYADELFSGLGIDPSVVTEEPDVRALATKLVEGELDAGVVYATDVRAAAGELRTVAIPPDSGVEATYPIAAITDSSDREAALDFLAFVRSGAGRAILRDAGFEVPG